MTNFTDPDAKAACQALCDKRNKSIGKHHPLRWKALHDSVNGWKPQLRPPVEREVVKKKVLHRDN